MYDPKASREWKALARGCYAVAQETADLPTFVGSLSVEVIAFFRCPNRCREPHSIRKTSRPDCDNIAKAALDAGNGILWADDAQVAELHVSKWVCYSGQEPFVEVTVRELEA